MDVNELPQTELAIASTSGIIKQLNGEIEEQLDERKMDPLGREPTVESGILTYEVTNESTCRTSSAD